MDSTSLPAPQTEGEPPEAKPLAAPEDAPLPPTAPLSPWRRWVWIVDLLLFLVLCVMALPVRFQYTRGDFWLDEADYAMASVQGFQANRWDRSGTPGDPDSLVRSRHYHAPLTAQALGLARHWSSEDRALRVPFVLAGGLSVGLVYLCGLALFDRRREIAIGCAALVICTPAHIRMSSHAVPWSLIILEILLLLWTLIQYAQTRRPGWLVGACVALGGLFVTSETFFVALGACACLLPFLLWPDLRDPSRRRRVLAALGMGIGVFLLLAVVLWPAGLTGGAVKMLRHYVHMRNVEFPVNVGDRVYAIAPKWAYFYWYWHDYRPFFVCYVLGTLALLVLMALRKVPTGTGALVAFSLAFLAAAHKAHIIGPEYLAHCLPLLTLLGGFFLLAASRLYRPLGVALILLVGFSVYRWTQPRPLPGMDRRAQIARWPAAARFLATQWRPGDRLLIGPQPAVVARWYLLQWASVPAADVQIGQLPIHDPSPAFLAKLRGGKYHYVVVSSAFEDRPDLDPRSRLVLQTWHVIWQSDEQGTGLPRLTVYQFPQS